MVIAPGWQLERRPQNGSTQSGKPQFWNAHARRCARAKHLHRAATAARDAWERLLREDKLGALALLRNLRNLRDLGVHEDLVLSALGSMSTVRVLPFRFLAAARYAPQWEETLEQAMLNCVASQEKLPGKTIVLVDVSGSMTGPLSPPFGDAA